MFIQRPTTRQLFIGNPALTVSETKKAAAGFDPSTITWAFAFAARLESYANNDPVGTITGQFGTPSFTQTGDARSTFKTNIQNGQPAYLFDGTDDTYDSGVISHTQPLTMIIVGVHLGTFLNLNNRFWLRGKDSSEAGIYAGNAAGGRWTQAGNFGGAEITASPFVPSILIAEFNGTSNTIEVNGVDYPVSWNAGAYGLTRLYVGSVGGSSNFAYGYFNEGYVKSGSLLTTQEKDDMRAYLNGLYATF